MAQNISELEQEQQSLVEEGQERNEEREQLHLNHH